MGAFSELALEFDEKWAITRKKAAFLRGFTKHKRTHAKLYLAYGMHRWYEMHEASELVPELVVEFQEKWVITRNKAAFLTGFNKHKRRQAKLWLAYRLHEAYELVPESQVKNEKRRYG